MPKASRVCLPVLVGATFLIGQQATPPRKPTLPLTQPELEAIALVGPHTGKSVRKALFDGKTLDGWKGNPSWWSVQDGEIVGKWNDKLPTSFLFTTDNYSDFRLTLSSRMVESENHAGVCLWGQITTLRDNPWYTRGPLVMFPSPGMWDYTEAAGLRVYKPTEEKVTSQHNWIKVEILAQGNRVRSAFNGVEVMEWREAMSERVNPGPIGLQLHAWPGPQEVRYKDIEIETFPLQSTLLTLKSPAASRL